MVSQARRPQEQIERIIETAAGDDPEWRDRLQAVETTFQREDASVAGFRSKVQGVLPDHVSRQIDSYLTKHWRENNARIAGRDMIVDIGVQRGSPRRIPARGW